MRETAATVQQHYQATVA